MMNTWKKGWAVLLATMTGVSSLAIGTAVTLPTAAADTETVKILPLGDSITDGYWTSGAYRKYLYRDLEQMGYDNIDMVGPKGSNSNTFTYNGETVTYDDNNAGYSGYAIQAMTTKEQRSGILETIQGTWYNGKNMIAAYDPDVVLLQIGTNDILSEYNDGITDRLENLVNVILEDLDDDAVVFVATIPDIDAYLRADWLSAYGINAWSSTDAEKDQLMETVTGCIDSYNTSIYNLVLEMQSEGKSVRYADINSVVNYETDLYDGVHPNEAGYENMGDYWANLLNGYFQESGITDPKPVTTTEATTTATTATETTVATQATTQATAATTQAATTTATTKATTVPTTTTTTSVTIPEGATEVHLSGVTAGSAYDISAYSGASAISFTFTGSLQYGINGCVSFNNWQSYRNYTQDDFNGLTLTMPLDETVTSFTFNKWYGAATLSDVVLYFDTESTTEEVTTTTTTTTAKPTTTTTTTTTTAKPTTTTTTTTTTAKPITTTTTTTTAKPTTTTTTTTTTKPTTTTTTTTTTAKPTTTTTTTTTAKPTTTATTTTTTAPTTTSSSEKTVVLTDVKYGSSYDLSAYDPSAIKKIVLQLDGDVGYGFGGKLVLGGWVVQMDYGAANLQSDNTITFEITNPQNVMTLFNYWGNMKLESVTLVY